VKFANNSVKREAASYACGLPSRLRRCGDPSHQTLAPKPLYAVLTVVFLGSAAAYVLLPHGELIQQLAAVPLVGSLVAALVQTLRDQAAHERQLILQASEHQFAIGASSHMADVAFDKHVIFCEEYVQEVFATLGTLFREGPTENVLPHASTLFQIRNKHAVWLTNDLDSDLQKFEGALRKIGASDWYLRNAERAEDRQQKIEEMYKTLADVLGQENMGPEWQGQPLSADLAISTVIRGLRQVLGTEELTELRSALVQSALINVKENS